MSEYLESITALLKRIESEEAPALDCASDAVADVICRDALVHVFGCGHSHLAALDAFYRAGGLACVSPVLDEDLMLHDGAAKSSRMEKMPGIAAEVFRRHGVKPGDLFVVISASGKNAARSRHRHRLQGAARRRRNRGRRGDDGRTFHIRFAIHPQHGAHRWCEEGARSRRHTASLHERKRRGRHGAKRRA